MRYCEHSRIRGSQWSQIPEKQSLLDIFRDLNCVSRLVDPLRDDTNIRSSEESRGIIRIKYVLLHRSSIPRDNRLC